MENKKVLIVEDEPALLDIMRNSLSRAGLTIFTAVDGEEGLKAASEKMPDLILADIMMPKMDGLTMLKHLQADAKTKKIPAIVLTNVNDLEMTANALEMGVEEYLIKTNLEMDKLIERVKQALK